MAPSYLSLPANHYFDHAFLQDTLRPYQSVADKITLMLRRGEITRIRKGLYIRSRLFGGTVEPLEIANAVYGPSYVSLEYALSRYAMIPERVVTITCVTSKRSKSFETPVALFTYTHIPAAAYAAGVTIEMQGAIGVLIATPEKALCDKLAQAAHVRSTKDIATFLIEDQRIDTKELAGLSQSLLDKIGADYAMPRISLFVSWFRKNFSKGATTL
jgi:predicted transcriptional regulator of viral defense system